MSIKCSTSFFLLSQSMSMHCHDKAGHGKQGKSPWSPRSQRGIEPQRPQIWRWPACQAVKVESNHSNHQSTSQVRVLFRFYLAYHSRYQWMEARIKPRTIVPMKQTIGFKSWRSSGVHYRCVQFWSRPTNMPASFDSGQQMWMHTFESGLRIIAHIFGSLLY